MVTELPAMTEVPLSDIVPGDAAWSPDDRCFYFVDSAVRIGMRMTLVYAGGLTAVYDLNKYRRILRAHSPSAAEDWNQERFASEIGDGGEAA